MKMTIEWHEGCIKNNLHNLDRKKAELKMLENEIKKDQQRHDFYTTQIDLAKKSKKDSFDAEKFGYKRLIGI